MTFAKKLSQATLLLLMTATLGLSGCMSTGNSADDEAANAEARAKAEADIKAEMAKIPDSSKLSQIELGMTDTRVRKLIGEPDDSTSYQTGKAWIPFYYGTDVARTDWLYYGEGRVVFSINRYSGQAKVINVMYNPEE